MKTIIVTLLSSLLLVVTGKPTLTGIWVYNSYEKKEEETFLVYVRANSFNKNKGGMHFKKDGSIVIRQNESWCGTPPITYKNYLGSWKSKNDSALTLKHQFWGGKMERELRIISLQRDTLKVTYLVKAK